MIYDNLMNIHDDMLDILDKIDLEEIDPENPMVISWDYEDCDMKFTLLIHNKLPDEVDFHESEVIH